MFTSKLFFPALLITLFSCLWGQAQTTVWTETDKIVASDRQAGALFGGLGNGVKTVSIHGDYAVVGAERNDHSGLIDAGAAYVYKRNATGGWSFQQKLTASNPQEYASFGSSVAISEYDDFIVVGSPDYDGSSFTNPFVNSGTAYLFQRNTFGIWVQVQQLLPTYQDLESNARFGNSVDITTRRVIVGASNESQDPTLTTVTQSGAAYIFERNGSANVWNLIQKLTASDRNAGNHFGRSVAISGNYAIAGAPDNNLDANGGNVVGGSGSAYVFEKIGAAPWTEVIKITSTDRNLEEHYGGSVDIDDKYLIVGAIGDDLDETGSNSIGKAGSAFIYSRSSAGNWTLNTKVVPNDRETYDFFGLSVGIDKIGFAVVGTYLEDHDETGGSFLNRSGSAYVFNYTGNIFPSWNQYQKIVASDRSTFDEFGASVSIDEKHIVVSARKEDHDEFGGSFISDAGSAYIYKLGGLSPSPSPAGKSANNSVLESEFLNGNISLAPNPSSGLATLTFSKFKENQSYEIVIYDCAGRIILQDLVTSNNYQLDLRNQENGIYIVQLNDGITTERLRLVISE